MKDVPAFERGIGIDALCMSLPIESICVSMKIVLTDVRSQVREHYLDLLYTTDLAFSMVYLLQISFRKVLTLT